MDEKAIKDYRHKAGESEVRKMKFNVSKGITFYLLVIIVIALIFFSESKFSTTIYGILHSLNLFIKSLMEPTDTAMYKLIFVCLTFVFIVKLLFGGNSGKTSDN